MTLHEHFAQHFQRDDLHGAKVYAHRWANEWNQYIPELGITLDNPDDMFSQRAMAGHISDYLEGFTGEEPDSYSNSGKIYLSTKYGSDIYWAMGPSGPKPA